MFTLFTFLIRSYIMVNTQKKDYGLLRVYALLQSFETLLRMNTT